MERSSIGHWLRELRNRGVWGTQWVGRPTLDFSLGRDRGVVRWSAALGSVFGVELGVPLCPSPHALAIIHSINQSISGKGAEGYTRLDDYTVPTAHTRVLCVWVMML